MILCTLIPAITSSKYLNLGYKYNWSESLGLITKLICEVSAWLPESLAGCHGYHQWSGCKRWRCPAVYVWTGLCAEAQSVRGRTGSDRPLQ